MNAVISTNDQMRQGGTKEANEPKPLNSSAALAPDAVWEQVYRWVDCKTFVHLRAVDRNLRDVLSVPELRSRVMQTFGGKHLALPALPVDKSGLLTLWNQRMSAINGVAAYVRDHGGKLLVEGQNVRQVKWCLWDLCLDVTLQDHSRRLIKFFSDGEIQTLSSLIVCGPERHPVKDMAVSPSGKWFLTKLEDGAVELRDLTRPAEKTQLLVGSEIGFMQPRWSPRERFLWVNSDIFHSALFDFSAGQPKRVSAIRETKQNCVSAFSDDDKLFFMFDVLNEYGSVWNMEEEPRRICYLPQQDVSVAGAHLSKTGQFLALYRLHRSPQIYAMRRDQLQLVADASTHPFPDRMVQVVFSGDEKNVLIGTGPKLASVFSLEVENDGAATMKLLRDDVYRTDSFFQDRYVVVVKESMARLWDVAEQKFVHAEEHGFDLTRDYLNAVEKVPGGRYVHFSFGSSCSKLVDLSDLDSVPISLVDPDSSQAPSATYFAPDGRCALNVLRNKEGAAQIWDLTDKPKWVGSLTGILNSRVSFSNDGRFLVSAPYSSKGESKIWNLTSYLSYLMP